MRKFPRAIAHLVVTLVFTAAAASVATATPITDTDSGNLTIDPQNSTLYQQSDISPCVIGGPSCDNPDGFDKTLAGSGGAGSVFNLSSPMYNVGQITDISGGNQFRIGLDYNQTNDAQTLYLFKAEYFDANGSIGAQLFDLETVLQTIHQGVGFSDFILSGFVIPTGTTKIQFTAKWFNNDGADRYFLIAEEPGEPCTENCNQAPEPASLALFGMAAAAAAVVRRRRK